MWSWSAEVTIRDDRCCRSACWEGMAIPNPPIRAGRTNKAHSRSLGGDFPVSDGNEFGLQDVIEWLQEVTDVWDCVAQVGPLAGKTMCEGRVSCVWLGPSYSC